MDHLSKGSIHEAMHRSRGRLLHLVGAPPSNTPSIRCPHVKWNSGCGLPRTVVIMAIWTTRCPQATFWHDGHACFRLGGLFRGIRGIRGIRLRYSALARWGCWPHSARYWLGIRGIGAEFGIQYRGIAPHIRVGIRHCRPSVQLPPYRVMISSA